MAPPNPRPVGVTVVALLTMLIGAGDLAAGLALLLNQTDPALRLEHVDGFGVVAVGYVTVAIGLVIIATGVMLWRGSRGARGVVTVLMAVQLIGGILIFFENPAQWWAGVVSIVAAIVVVALLWTSRAREYFDNSWTGRRSG